MNKIKRLCAHCGIEFETTPAQNYRHCSFEHCLEDTTTKAYSKYADGLCWNWQDQERTTYKGGQPHFLPHKFGTGSLYMKCRN